MPEDYITRQEFNISNGMLIKDIEKLSKVVDKVVDKMDNYGEMTTKNTESIKTHDAMFDKFNDILDKMSNILNRVDKETALNTQSIGWSLELNWKTISAILGGLTVMFTAILSAWKG